MVMVPLSRDPLFPPETKTPQRVNPISRVRFPLLLSSRARIKGGFNSSHIECVLERILVVNEEILKLMKEEKERRKNKTKSRKLMKRKLFKLRKIVKRKKKVVVHVEVEEEEKNEDKNDEELREKYAAVEEKEEKNDAQVDRADEEMTGELNGRDAAVEEEKKNEASVDGEDEEITGEGNEKDAAVEEEAKNDAPVDGEDAEMQERVADEAPIDGEVAEMNERDFTGDEGGDNRAESEEVVKNVIVEENRETQAAVQVDEADVFVNQVLMSLNDQFASENSGADNI